MRQFLADIDTLRKKTKMRIPFNNRFILLVWLEGEVYAIQDKCPHMGASLFPGKLEGEIVFCKDHNLGVSLKTGLVVNDAQADHLKLESYNRSVRTFEVVVENGKIYFDK